MQRSCSSFRVSVKRVSPALAPAIIPAFDTNESVNVDFPEKCCGRFNMIARDFPQRNLKSSRSEKYINWNLLYSENSTK